MIITVSCQDVKDHSSEKLFSLWIWQFQCPHCFKKLFICERVYIVKVEMLHSKETLHMNFFVARFAVKSLGHEMCPAVFFKQSALCHFYPGISCHKIVGHFHTSISAACTELSICYTVKLKKPLRETFGGIGLSATDFTGCLIKCNQHLGSGTGRRGPHFQYIRHCLFLILRKAGREFLSSRQDIIGNSYKLIYFHLTCFV
jgi:hypothetical protein